MTTHFIRKIPLKGILRGNQLRKLSGLLDMLYTPAELAGEIGVTRRQIYRVYEPLGCPIIRNSNGHIYINGKTFCNWYKNFYAKTSIGAQETFCLACKGVIPLINPVEQRSGHYRYWSANCPICKNKVSKAISNKRGEND